MSVIEASDAQLPSILSQNMPFLIDFYNDQCGPCRAMEPVIQQVAAEGRIQVIKINTGSCPEAARFYQISSVPTLIFGVGGPNLKILRQHSGTMDKAAIDATVNELLSHLA